MRKVKPMIDFVNETDFEVAESLLSELSAILNELTKKEVELIFVDDVQIKEINKTHRNKDESTDVLSFPLDFPEAVLLGSVIISLDTAKAASIELCHSLEEEVKILFIHGILHLLGFDHEIDNGVMRKKEEELIEKLGLPKSLINRNE